MSDIPRAARIKGVPRLSDGAFQKIRGLVYEQSGLDLRAGKETLVSARLGKKIRESNCDSFDEYLRQVSDDTSGKSMADMIDALTTNYTSFFREPEHFEFLRETVLPKLCDRKTIRIWSAACATGEEPYSIAICLKETFTENDRIQIIGTDISTRALATAQKALYRGESLRDLDEKILRMYFLRGTANWAGWYRVKDEVRSTVSFEHLNLINGFSEFGMFPLIFCRNVMIYFDKPTQARLISRLTERLEPGGYLLIGHAESLNSLDHSLEYVKPATYRNPTQTGAWRRGRINK